MIAHWAPGSGINPGWVHVDTATQAQQQSGDTTLGHQAHIHQHSHTGPSAIRGYNPRATGPHQYGHTGPTTFGGYNPWAPGPGINPRQVHINMAYRADRQLGDSTL